MTPMEQTAAPDPRQDPLQGLPEIKTIAVNQGFIPESLLFWRRWRKSTSEAP